MLARELSYYPTETKKVRQNPKRNYKKIEQRKRRNNSIAKLVIMTMPIIALGISLTILFRYANITAVRQEITKLERQKIDLDRVKTDLIAELEGIKTSVKISEDAITKLGMNYPTEGQIVYISIGETVIEEAKKPNLGIKIRKVLGSLF